MAGDGCFAVATDLRFGQDLKTVTMDFPKAFEMAPNLWLGLTGLATDVLTVKQKMEFRKQMFELTENRKMKPQVLFSKMGQHWPLFVFTYSNSFKIFDYNERIDNQLVIFASC